MVTAPATSHPLSALLDTASRHWWLVALRGGVAVLFGVLAWIWPGITLIALVFLWGIYALTDGVLSLVTAFRWRDSGKPLWMLIIVGLAGIAAGVLTFLSPAITGLVLLMFIAAWAVVMGIFQIVAAIRLRKEISNEWLLGLSGLISVVFGVLMIVNPGAGALAVVWIIGGYSVFFGLLLIGLGFKLKGLAGKPNRKPNRGRVTSA